MPPPWMVGCMELLPMARLLVVDGEEAERCRWRGTAGQVAFDFSVFTANQTKVTYTVALHVFSDLRKGHTERARWLRGQLKIFFFIL